MIKLSHHAFVRICDMDVGIDEIVAATTEPSLRYPGPPQHGHGRCISVRDRVAVVHTDSQPTTVITVLWHGANGR